MYKTLIKVLFILLAVSACSPATPVQDETLKVVATTTIVGDIVFQIGGDHIDLTVLLPVGSDPHGFQATPQDLAAIADADLVFINGLGLEEFLSGILENAEGSAVFVPLSDDIPNLLKNEDHAHDEDQAQDEDHSHDDEEFDPHVWLNPNNIGFWVEIIEEYLNEFDPENSKFYDENSASYLLELEKLDGWISENTETIPFAQRLMIADHNAWGYFADAYGFELIGTIIPGYSTLAEASAGDLADLETLIEDLNARTIFIGNSINPDLATQIAEDTGIEVVVLYTGSLSKANGPAPNYIEMMQHNVELIMASYN